MKLRKHVMDKTAHYLLQEYRYVFDHLTDKMHLDHLSLEHPMDELRQRHKATVLLWYNELHTLCMRIVSHENPVVVVRRPKAQKCPFNTYCKHTSKYCLFVHKFTEVSDRLQLSVHNVITDRLIGCRSHCLHPRDHILTPATIELSVSINGSSVIRQTDRSR